MAIMSSQYFRPNTRLSMPLVRFDPALAEVDDPYFLMKHIVTELQEKELFDVFLALFTFCFGYVDRSGLDERLLFLAIIKRMTKSHKNGIPFTKPRHDIM